MPQPALNPGPQATPDHRDRIITSLEEENRDLKKQIEAMKLEAQQTNKAVEQGVSELRKILLPLHQGMRLIFAEIDHIVPSGGETHQVAPASDKKHAVWESWKQKLGGKPADLIDALLVHEEMSAVQLRVAMKCHINSVYECTARLQKMGLVNKNGGKYSLKEL